MSIQNINKSNLIINCFNQYNLITTIYIELENFLNAKDEYIKKENHENYGRMLMLYDMVYTSLKSEMSYGRINMDDFRYLTELLKEGLWCC